MSKTDLICCAESEDDWLQESEFKCTKCVRKFTTVADRKRHFNIIHRKRKTSHPSSGLVSQDNFNDKDFDENCTKNTANTSFHIIETKLVQFEKQEHLDLIDMRSEVPIVSLIPQPDFTNERKVAKFLKVIHSFSYMGKPKFCLVRA